MGNRVYVGNLPYQVSTQELRDVFSQSGTVVDAKVLIDRETGQSRGFGFVTFASDAEAAKAIEDWNNSDFGGRRLVVNEAYGRTSGSRGGGGGWNNNGFRRDYGSRGGGGGWNNEFQRDHGSRGGWSSEFRKDRKSRGDIGDWNSEPRKSYGRGRRYDRRDRY